MPADVDDGSIADDAGLLRRIHPNHIVDDENTGKRRPSSAAFKDMEMSVDVEPLLIAAGLDWQFSLREHSGYSLVRLRAGAARAVNLAVVHKPIAGQNEAHAEVIGKKSPAIANHLREASEWVHQA